MAREPNIAEPRHRVRALLVDDDDLVRKTLGLMLEAAGYEVCAFGDPATALVHLEQCRVDVVVLDVMMPGMSGFEACRRIKNTPFGECPPVVLLTALGEAQDVLAGLEAGADEFLTKPIDPAVLDARLRALLRFARAQAGRPTPQRSLPELIAERVAELCARGNVSPREREVLDLLLLGRSLDEIAQVLDITSRTVKFHQANLLQKLGADSRLDLLRLML